jgi:hypothetical protein
VLNFQTIEVTIRGIVPLLMHNGQMANPLNPIVQRIKEITGKRKKTDADYRLLADLEWMGGLYLDDKDRVVVPGHVIEGAMTKSAKKIRQGDQVKTGVVCDGNWPLDYDGPKALGKLKDDPRFRDTRGAKVNGKSTVQRTRPIFRNWSLTFRLEYDPSIINRSDVIKILEGAVIGDYIPKFGRYAVESTKDVKVAA